MEIKFEKDYLEELYLKGKTSDKKYRFQPPIVTKYRKTIDLLESGIDRGGPFQIPLIALRSACWR